MKSAVSRRANVRPGACLGLLALATLVACSSPSDEAGGVAAPERPRVALIMKSLANEFFVTMADGARDHQAHDPERYELVVNGTKDESDLAQQVSLVEQMVATGVDALVIAPADSKALVPALRRARDAGLVVVNIDNRLDREVLEAEGLQIPFVGPDNRAGARAVGEALAARLEPGAEVAIIGGIPTAFNAQQRQAGFEDAMTAAGARVVEVQSGGWEQAKANVVASALLSEHPDLAALLCANDNMALGALAAARQAGRDDLLIVGFDNIDAVASLVESGEILATADQHADQLAVYGIEAALEIVAAGDPASVADSETPVDLITGPRQEE